MTTRHKRIVGHDRAQTAATGDRTRARATAWRSLPDRPTRAVATNRQLAAAAREHAARELAGSHERRAWGCLTVALGTTGTVASARRVLDFAPAEIRDTAKNLLDQITRERGDAMPDEFVIHSATGRPLITVRKDGAKVALSVRASRNGTPVTITGQEADDLAAALTRRWPMCGPPSTEALSSGDWRPKA